MEYLGWISSILLSICSIPQVVRILKEGNANSLAAGYILMWALGNLLTQIYIVNTVGWQLALLSKYWVNDIFLIIMIKYKFFPRKLNDT